MEWIACSERMPEEKSPVLVHAENGVITAAFVTGEPWRFWEVVGVEGYSFSADWYMSPLDPYRGVTHWMPLPPPPNL